MYCPRIHTLGSPPLFGPRLDAGVGDAVVVGKADPIHAITRFGAGIAFDVTRTEKLDGALHVDENSVPL